jgi:hypothetical protein
MQFVIKIQNRDSNGKTRILTCAKESRCTLTYHKGYTPVLYYINPPVVYQGVYTDFWFNPKNVPAVTTIMKSDDLPFVNAKIGNALVNF